MTNNYLNLIENNHDLIYEEYGRSHPWVSYNKEDKNVYYNLSQDYVEIGGIKWATKCIGASSPYTYDADLFQWGETTGHKEGVDYDYSWSNAPFVDNTWASFSGFVSSNKVLLSSYDAATQLMGKSPIKGYSWRMPTKEEFVTLVKHTLSLYSGTVKGVDGTEITMYSRGVGLVKGVKGKCYGKTTTSTNNILFLPFRGYGYYDEIHDAELSCKIWSSSLGDGYGAWTSSPLSDFLFSSAYGLSSSLDSDYVNDASKVFYGQCILGVLAQN